MLKALLISLLTCQVASSIVKSLTPSDDFGQLLDMESVIIIQYEDRKNQDWESFDKVFRDVANQFSAPEEFKSDSLLEKVLIKLQWFSVDARRYPELEDSTHSRVIAGPGEQYRRGGSYVFILLEGRKRLLEFKYQASKTDQELRDLLSEEINKSFARPIVKLMSCESLSYLYQKDKDVQFMAVWFQSKPEKEIGSSDKKMLEINQNLSTLARQEFFHYEKQERVHVFRIYDPKCAQRFEITSNDTIVLYIKTTETTDAPVISNDKLFNLPYIKRWIATAISDVERVFSKRAAYSVMNEQINVIILLRQGGKPVDEEDFDEMDKTEKRICQQFNSFIDRFKFKQQRVLWFFADLQEKPLDNVTLSEFFKLDISVQDLPALIHVNTNEAKVTFFEELSRANHDRLASWVFNNSFQDLKITSDKSQKGSSEKSVQKVIEDI